MAEFAGESSRLLPKNDDEPSFESRRLFTRCDIPPRFALILMMGMLVGAALLRFEPPEMRPGVGRDPDSGSTTSIATRNAGEGSGVSGTLHGLSASSPARLSGQLRVTGGSREVDLSPLKEEGEDEPESPPNVIFILMDDVGMNDLGYLSTDLKTVSPFIDSLANDGVKLTRYYTNQICTPARVSGHFVAPNGPNSGTGTLCDFVGLCRASSPRDTPRSEVSRFSFLRCMYGRT